MKSAVIHLNGKQTGFVARESKFGTCEGCLFDKGPFSTCSAASALAVEAGQPDCDDLAPNHGNYVYVDADPRQLVLGEGS